MHATELDGFQILPHSELEFGSTANLQPYRNEFSLAIQPGRVRSGSKADTVAVDRYYGQIYDVEVEPGAAIYGPTDRIPGSPNDERADLGFLRVPFTRIPRFRARNRAEIDTLLSAIDGQSEKSVFMFRGQNKEYSLGRSPETLECLYGDPETLEPSLLPSGVRYGMDNTTIAPLWASLLNWMIDVFMAYQGEKDIMAAWTSYRKTYLYQRLATAIAQHYGLPSFGLDVTDRLDVALYFALREFTTHPTTPNGLLTRPVSGEDHEPVLYVFEVYQERELSHFRKETPTWLPLLRPERQSAHFLHSGWGLGSNNCARRLVAAIYLDMHGDFGDIPTTSELFPDADEDWCATSLSMINESASKHLPEALSKFVSHFHSVSSE